MKKVIANKIYDTEASSLIKKRTYGEYGSPDGYEESLYRTPEGSYFIYTSGGEKSKYKKEDIKRASEKTAQEFLLTE